ncbi:matrixin family metalloprotease [Streptomyces sp. AK04-3B]|uniref:matrixin family metalloprotease n=1 Tax=Streptomyces sp. AK04-3B TaxID=3028650 RepID=UPI0029B0EE54|nr:matrixin family metalloprotease [Streptomyces sp. AK04-3B]MDX3800903.1 matrixin family metalloprotease [Streptomyces sp. AK04-3B]
MAGRRGPDQPGRAITAFLLAVTLAAACVGQAPRTPSCPPARGELTVDDLPAGSSVLDCPAVGRVITHDGAGLAVPEPGTTVSVDALTADGSAHGFTLTVAADGTVSYAYEAARTEAVRGGRADAPAPCADAAYATAGRKEYGTYEWFLGDGRLPGGISRAEARRAFEDAVATITASRNDCGLDDRVAAKARYLATTSSKADIDRETRCMRPDGLSVWDTGDLGGDAVATTCSWSRPAPGGGPEELLEADVRFNTHDHAFTDDPSGACTRAYDLRSVATHEAGHVFGLGHSGPGHENLTMFASSFACSTSARTLGKGDVLGLRSLY